MPSLMNINFPDSAKVFKALTSFYAIGQLGAQKIMAQHYIHSTAKMGSLSSQLLMDLTSQLSKMKIESEARKSLQDNIKRLRDMGSYRGRRHVMGLPVRGQNTRSQINSARRLNRLERVG